MSKQGGKVMFGGDFVAGEIAEEKLREADQRTLKEKNREIKIIIGAIMHGARIEQTNNDTFE